MQAVNRFWLTSMKRYGAHLAFVSVLMLAMGMPVKAAWAQSLDETSAPNDLKNSKILRLESEIRTLTGRIEQLEFDVQQLLQNAPDEAVSQNVVPQAQLPDEVESEGGTVKQTQSLALEKITPEVHLDLSTNGQKVSVPADVLDQAPTQADADALYGAGFQAILIGDFVFAEEQFRQFLALYEDHEKTADATHWLGESLLQQFDFGDAAEIFQKGYEAHEESNKAPDMLLKLGVALARGGEQEIGCRTFKEVIKRYPETSNAFKARLKREIDLAKCSAE